MSLDSPASPTRPNDFGRLPEPYPGPTAGGQMSGLDVLAEIADSQANARTAVLPTRTGPPTGGIAATDSPWIDRIIDEWENQQHVRESGIGNRGRRGGDDADNGERRGGGHHRRHRRPHPRRTRRVPLAYTRQAARVLIVAVTAAILAGMAAVTAGLPVSPILAGYWVLGAAVITLCLGCFAKGRSWSHLPAASGDVLAIIPAYNEPPGNLEGCVRSLLAQTVPPDRIIVVDDGSAVPVVPFDAGPRVEWIRQPNTGKRGAQCTALRRHAPGEFRFVMTVDSDSRPHPDALEHLLRSMSDPGVQASTGWLYITNWAESWVSRAADIDIGGSCVMMRASRSMLGALETTSGALALYRSEILYDHLEEYAVECGTGDDRWLAMRALLRGEVVGVEEAVVDTEMPATLNGTFRQRLRWARSWWWMVPFAYARLTPKQLISPTYGIVQLAIAPVVIAWAAVSWAAGIHERLAHPEVALGFLGSYVTVRLALSALYLVGRPGMPRREKLRSLLLGTPAAVLMNLFLLMPTRYYALARLNDNRWQARQVKAAAE